MTTKDGSNSNFSQSAINASGAKRHDNSPSKNNFGNLEEDGFMQMEIEVAMDDKPDRATERHQMMLQS